MPLLLVQVLEERTDLQQLRDGDALASGEMREVRIEPGRRRPLEDGADLLGRPLGARGC